MSSFMLKRIERLEIENAKLRLELAAAHRTIGALSDNDTVRGIAAGIEDLKAGRCMPLEDIRNGPNSDTPERATMTTAPGTPPNPNESSKPTTEAAELLTLRLTLAEAQGTIKGYEEAGEKLKAELKAAARDTARLDWLEGELAREQKAHAEKSPCVYSLFRSNMPITREAIDARMEPPR